MPMERVAVPYRIGIPGTKGDIANRAVDFIKRQKNANKPFFVWVNYDPHALPHSHQAGEHRPVRALAEPVSRHHDRPRQECRHRSSRSLDDLGIADNTVVMYCDRQRSAHEQLAGWRDDRRSATKRTRTGRAPTGCRRCSAGRARSSQVRYPTRCVAHHDLLPTLLAMAGDTQVKDKLLKGYKVGDMTYKVHLDGDNLVSPI